MTSIQTLRSTLTDTGVEWNATANKLCVFALTTDGNLALFSNEAVYGLLPAAPVGQVIIRWNESLPDLAGALERAHIIHVTTRIVDRADLGAARLQVATVLTDPMV